MEIAGNKIRIAVPVLLVNLPLLVPTIMWMDTVTMRLATY
jgi:hypothetical protein